MRSILIHGNANGYFHVEYNWLWLWIVDQFSIYLQIYFSIPNDVSVCIHTCVFFWTCFLTLLAPSLTNVLNKITATSLVPHLAYQGTDLAKYGFTLWSFTLGRSRYQKVGGNLAPFVPRWFWKKKGNRGSDRKWPDVGPVCYIRENK